MFLARQQTALAVSLVLAATVAAACGKQPVEGEIQQLGLPAQLTVTSEGGIAALRVIVRLDSATGLLSRATCQLSVSSDECGTKGHLDQVTLSSQQVASTFAITQSPEFRALRSDYGTSTQGADLMGHSVTVIANHRTREIKGDDLTLPPAIGRLKGALYTPLQSSGSR